MAHVGQNALWTNMWDPPEGSLTKYHVLSVAHIRHVPWILSLLVAHISKYAPLIISGPHLGPTGPTSVSAMHGAHLICATDNPPINGAYSICAMHTWWVPPLWKGGRLISGAYFSICATNKLTQIYKLAAPPPPFHSSPSSTKLDLARPPPPHNLNFSILASILGCWTYLAP
jgi:hypothetical protein